LRHFAEGNTLASLGASFAKIGGNTLLSRLLGFVRDLIVARVFGADVNTDAFFVAFKIPNFMRRLFAEGAFSLALVPVLHEHRSRRGFPELRRFVDDLTGTLGGVLLAVTVLGVIGAPILILVFAPGFAGAVGKQLLATEMLRLTFPYVLFISLTALAAGILNTYERFGVPAFTPVLLNLSLIGCALFLAPRMEQPIMALAWGVLIAGIAQFGLQLPFLARLELLPRPRFNPRNEGVRRVFGRMAPALFGVSVTQIGLLLDTVLASFLVTGSISWLYYSERLMEFPMGILGVALGTVILPKLSQKHQSAQSLEAFSLTLEWALRWVLLLGVPAAVGLSVLAAPLMATLFQTEAFTARDVTMASYSLMVYAIGLVAFMCVKVLAPGYYARQDARTPVRFALVALGTNLVLSLLLMRPLGHAGLALATTIGASVNAGLLMRGLVREGVFRPRGDWRPLMAKGLGASLLMGVLIWWGSGESGAWIAASSWERVVRLAGWILAGLLVYFTALFALGVRPRHFLAG
jgi:putative peptidoglycan lipid II flippase